jgi:hypothetical protein
VRGLDNQQAGEARNNQLRQLGTEKDDLRNKVSEMEQQLGNLSRQSLSNGQRDAARKFQEAAGTVREEMLKEKIEYSKQAMQGGSEYSKPMEEQITSNIDTLKQRVDAAAGAAQRADQGQGLQRAAGQASDLVRGMSTLNDQMNQQLGDQNQQGQPGSRAAGPAGSRAARQQAKAARAARSAGPAGPGSARPGSRQGQGQGQGQQASRVRGKARARARARPGPGPGPRSRSGSEVRVKARPEASRVRDSKASNKGSRAAVKAISASTRA